MKSITLGHGKKDIPMLIRLSKDNYVAFNEAPPQHTRRKRLRCASCRVSQLNCAEANLPLLFELRRGSPRHSSL
jgi:hypothetical protein